MRRFAWLLVAVVLLGLAAFFMSRGDKPTRAKREGEIEFPRHPRDEEQLRNQRRRTLVPPPQPMKDQATEIIVKRDPLIMALPRDPKKSLVVFEVAGLRDSPVGKAWLDCLMKRDGKRGLDNIQKEIGLNPLEDIERVAVSSAPLMLMTVPTEKLKLDERGFTKRSFGKQGAIFERPPSKEVFATWGDSLLVTGPDARTVEESLERLESDTPQLPVIPDWSQYGDMYGSISPEELAKMLPEDQSALAEKIRSAVNRVDIHLDASEDVAFVADVEGPGEQDIADLGKSFGAALSLARIQAQSNDNDKLAEFLDYAAVHPHGKRFALDVALPFDLLKTMGPCRKWEEDDAPQAEPKP